MPLMLRRAFYHEGISAVGIDRITAEAGIEGHPLPALRSKKDLGLVYLERRHAPVMKGLSEVLAQSPHARDQIAEIFDRFHIEAEYHKFRGRAVVVAAWLGGHDWQELSRASVRRSGAESTHIARGAVVFWLPSYLVDTELFWGQDNLAFLDCHLRGEALTA